MTNFNMTHEISLQAGAGLTAVIDQHNFCMSVTSELFTQ